MKITETFVNVETGERTTVERDETPQEEALRLEEEAQVAALEAEAEAKATAKAALLAQLGITEEQAKLLLS
jgi:hypothetical protein